MNVEENGAANRMAIIVFSGTVDKLMAVANLAVGGVAMGMEVDLFLTNWGLLSFLKGDHMTNAKITSEFGDFAPTMLAAMREKHVPHWMDVLYTAKGLGDLHVLACSQTLELLDMKQEDLEEIVEEVTGVATFIGMAQNAGITLFI